MYKDRGKPLREGAFPFTRTMLFPPLHKKNTRDRAKGLRDHFGELYSESCIEDQSLIPRYGSRALSGKGREGQNLSTFVWVLIHLWRWLAWASVIEKPPFCESYCRAAERLPPPIEHHLSVGTLRRRVLCLSECLRYIIYMG